MYPLIRWCFFVVIWCGWFRYTFLDDARRLLLLDLRLLRHAKSLGYLQSVTDAARIATGELLVGWRVFMGEGGRPFLLAYFVVANSVCDQPTALCLSPSVSPIASLTR